MTTVVTAALLVLLMLALVSGRAPTPTPVVMMAAPTRSGDSAFVFLMGLLVLVILALRGGG